MIDVHNDMVMMNIEDLGVPHCGVLHAEDFTHQFYIIEEFLVEAGVV